jgi:hypothetical protein
VTKIIVKRVSLHGLLRGVIIKVDGKRCAKVGLNGLIEHELVPGIHSVHAQIDWMKSAPVTIDLKDGDTVSFVCRSTSRGPLLHKTAHMRTGQEPRGAKHSQSSPFGEDESPSGARSDSTADESATHEQAPEPAVGQPTDWAEILGVPPDASMGEIRAAYRQRISEYHPDRVATLGKELRELAERKSKDINTAYSLARHQNGGQAE